MPNDVGRVLYQPSMKSKIALRASAGCGKTDGRAARTRAWRRNSHTWRCRSVAHGTHRWPDPSLLDSGRRKRIEVYWQPLVGVVDHAATVGAETAPCSGRPRRARSVGALAIAQPTTRRLQASITTAR